MNNITRLELTQNMAMTTTQILYLQELLTTLRDIQKSIVELDGKLDRELNTREKEHKELNEKLTTQQDYNKIFRNSKQRTPGRKQNNTKQPFKHTKRTVMT